MKLVQAIKGYINNYGKKLETARRERGGWGRKVRAREKKVTREDLTSDEQQYRLMLYSIVCSL